MNLDLHTVEGTSTLSAPEPGHRGAHADIRAALDALFEPGRVYELRIPKAGKLRTVSGYFDSPDALAKEAASWDGAAAGVYLTLNPVNPDLRARASNRAKAYADSTTSDSDVVQRTRLMIDLDPRRPSGIAANDAEHAAALDRARLIQADLTAEGWPEPLFIDTGNGGRLDYRIDLPNDEQSKACVEAVLKALAFRYDDDVVAIDTTVGNAARIARIPGTLNAKGEGTPERPHRRAKLLAVPGKPRVVSPELLSALAARLPQLDPGSLSRDGRQTRGFDLSRWLADHAEQVPVLREGPWQGAGRRWLLCACPFNVDHVDGSAAILQHPSGAAVFRCLHSGCSERRWHDLRALIEPEADDHPNRESCYMGTDDDESCVPPRMDRYIAYINCRIDRRASYEQIKDHFRVSDRTLRRDLAAEESGPRRLRRFKDGHQWYLTVRRGSGLKAIRWDAPVAHEMREAAHLPPGFKRFIGPERGLPPNTFVLYQAFGDGFKTSFLINTAIENAKAGLRVVFVSHENNVDTFRQLIARRILGGAPLSSEEAREACSQTDWMHRLELKVADGSVHVDEFIDQLAEDRPDVIVYDYLNQSLIMVDKADQQSSLANIVQRLGQGLVDQGTPLFTAVQLSTDKGKPYAPETWQQRATVVLRAGVPVADADTGNRVVDLTILKNKAGSDRALTKCLRMEVCGLSHRILRVEGVKGSPDERGSLTEHDVLPSLPDSFSETELRKLLGTRLGRSKDHPQVREKANLRLIAWEAKGLVSANGGVWRKRDPEAPPTPPIFKRPIQRPTFDIPPPPARPEDPSGQAATADPQADTGLRPAASPGAEVTGGHTSPSGSKV